MISLAGKKVLTFGQSVKQILHHHTSKQKSHKLPYTILHGAQFPREVLIVITYACTKILYRHFYLHKCKTENKNEFSNTSESKESQNYNIL